MLYLHNKEEYYQLERQTVPSNVWGVQSRTKKKDGKLATTAWKDYASLCLYGNHIKEAWRQNTRVIAVNSPDN